MSTLRHFTVCGDVHGQYYDLLNIWEINGMPSETNPYIFNGECIGLGMGGIVFHASSHGVEPISGPLDHLRVLTTNHCIHTFLFLYPPIPRRFCGPRIVLC